MLRLRELQLLIEQGSLLIPLPLSYKGCQKWLFLCARVITKLYPDHQWRFASVPGQWNITNMLLFLRYLNDREMVVREKLRSIRHLKASST